MIKVMVRVEAQAQFGEYVGNEVAPGVVFDQASISEIVKSHTPDVVTDPEARMSRLATGVLLLTADAADVYFNSRNQSGVERRISQVRSGLEAAGAIGTAVFAGVKKIQEKRAYSAKINERQRMFDEFATE